MLFRAYLHRNPVAVSYFFGCGSQNQGIVVDPMEDQVDMYVQQSNDLNMQIRYVIDTHVHADHISGARLLAEKTGAKYVLHESARVSFDYKPVKDGEEIAAGNTILRFIHTPGHTPEHMSIVVTDKARGEEPWFVLTGHTLMVGDVGRTELASDVEEGARQLFTSLHEKLLVLPDHLEVYPGAYSGSVCGRSLSGKPSSTLGFEKRNNRALQIRKVSDFVAHMTQDIPPRPPAFDQVRAYNMGYTHDKPIQG